MSRGFWVVLLAGVSCVLLLHWVMNSLGDNALSVRLQRYNMTVAEEHLPRIRKLLAEDERFENVELYVYTGQNGAVALSGWVASEEDLFPLMKLIAEERLPVPVSWQVKVFPDSE